ncbi:hypothetical protein ZIOFF_053811 [Zingiber officinale]|uniref:Sodium/calcium exchanger membrane region domain-containing protein n=1 Tax=Zingiber officinale TaxID=94328 RepID=A0A8J5FDM9_ZINOF|nr:hypothetical protein ZIOFF_053811 [Zingiber officinale]
MRKQSLVADARAEGKLTGIRAWPSSLLVRGDQEFGYSASARVLAVDLQWHDSNARAQGQQRFSGVTENKVATEDLGHGATQEGGEGFQILCVDCNFLPDERHTEVIAVFITVSSFCCSFSMEYQTNLWDITLGVSLGSATQISMFVVPLCVMVAWITGIKMDLDLNLLETGSLIMAILVIAFTLQTQLMVLLQDGTSHYLKGLVPLLCYLAIGACFFVFKSPLE